MNSERLPNHFVYRLIPPRPTFHLDMNEEEAGIMARHAEYWSGQMETGKVVAYGPVVDGTGSWGLAVFHADSEDEARGVLADDPAIATVAARRSASERNRLLDRAKG